MSRHSRLAAPCCAIAYFVLATTSCRIEIGPPQSRAQAPDDPLNGTVTIYSSMYRHVIESIEPILAAKLPEVRVEWLQGGSEKLATRLDAELEAGAPQADIVMTSDPLWYLRAKREGHLHRFATLPALAMARELVDPDGAFVTSRVSTMVIAYNERKVAAADAPTTFTDLFSDRFSGRVTIPDPLGSGTAFTTLAFLARRDGVEILDRMKRARTVASGGNTSALARLESGEHDVGFLLLENVLDARRRGSPVAFRIPSDGAVLIPGPLAVLEKSRNRRAAIRVVDVLLSEDAQRAIVSGDMHSPLASIAAPIGAPTLARLLDTTHRWTPEFANDAEGEARDLRARFAKVMDAP